MTTMPTAWTPDSWRQHRAAKQPTWPDQEALEETIKKLGRLPPLIYAGEARELKSELARAVRGEALSCRRGTVRRPSTNSPPTA